MFLKKPAKTLIALCLMVVPALLLSAPDASAQSSARGNDVRIVAYMIEASDGVPGVDPEIRHIVKQFHDTFRYSTYKLVSKVPRKIPMNGETKINMPGGRELIVYALGYEDARINLKVRIIDKSGPGKSREVLNTQFRLVKRGTIVIGNYNYQKGKRILAISADM